MVVLLNLLPLFVGLVCLVIVFTTKNKSVMLAVAAAFTLFIVIYPKIQPSYMPKGTVQRAEIQQAEPSSAVVEDRNRKPVPSEERQAKQDEEYRLGAPSLRPDTSGLGIKP